MAQTRELRRRIRSIENTRKITHAMELVAGAKMRRAEHAVTSTRRYAELAWELLAELRLRSDIAQHPLLAGRQPLRRSAVFVVSGNRGLVGGFHERLLAAALEVIAKEPVPPLVVTTGKIVRDALMRRGVAIHADFPKKDLLADPGDASPIGSMLLSAYLNGTCDRVVMVYADFRSVMRQEVRVRTLLPVGATDPFLGSVDSAPERSVQRPSPAIEYLMEPSAATLLEAVVPNLLAIQVYQALLETTASEHAARMIAMRNASENADDIHDDLVLEFNNARKAGITQEILEIVAGQRSAHR